MLNTVLLFKETQVMQELISADWWWRTFTLYMFIEEKAFLAQEQYILSNTITDFILLAWKPKVCL